MRDAEFACRRRGMRYWNRFSNLRHKGIWFYFKISTSIQSLTTNYRDLLTNSNTFLNMAPTNHDTVRSFQRKAFDFENFVLEPAEIRQIEIFISKRIKPVQITEVAELIISNRLEKFAGIHQTRLYLPTEKYSVGERILFCFPNNKFVIGEILWIEKGHESTQMGRYDKLVVSLHGFEEEKQFASNCPTFPKKRYAEDGPKEGIILPINIVNEQREKIIPVIRGSLAHHEEFVNVDDTWFIRSLLPEIRPDELELCHDCIKENGKPLSSEFLTREVIKIAPESEKYEAFLFSLNYCLQCNGSFIKCKITEEIQWDIRRPVPPKTIQNTLSQEAIKLGFIKITKGLRDLIDYCNFSKEITFKAYGEYEVHAYIDNGADQIYGNEIKQWFEENQLKPGDMIHINSPDTPGEKPILYTTFQKIHDASPTRKDEKDHIRNSNLRHGIYNLLRVRYHYLHVKEIQRNLLETLSEQVELPTIQAILSHNDHLFVHATNSRGIWGLKIWVEKRPDIDPVSLGLAIREDDWVYGVLERVGGFLTIEEIARELAAVFVTHKDKILEITFFDVNDTRFIEFDGKWGLKSWTENWKKRILEIDKEILDYQNLVSLRSKLEQEEKAREVDLLRLEEKKEALQRSVSDILNKIQSVDHKVDMSQKRQNELHDKNKFVRQQLNAPKLGILYYLCVTVFILIAVLLTIIGELPYKIIGLLILIIVVLLMLRHSQSKRRVISEAKTIEDSILRIDHRLVQLNKELSDLKNEESLIQTESASIDLKINEAQSDLENLRGEIEGIKEEVNKYNVPLLHKEKETLVQKLKTAGVI